jgi:alkylated DNA repair dioxygenase AlkB
VEAAAAGDEEFNFVLLNYYRDQDDYVSPHSDAGQFLGSYAHAHAVVLCRASATYQSDGFSM